MIIRIPYLLFGLGTVLNGVYMLAAPDHWFHQGPPGVTDTGPMNPHFVRDVGVVYALAGLGLMWAAWNLAGAYPVHVMVTLFFVGHAVLHVVDILVGNLPVDHWVEDFPGVFLPAILFGAMALPAVWKRVEARLGGRPLRPGPAA